MILLSERADSHLDLNASINPVLDCDETRGFYARHLDSRDRDVRIKLAYLGFARFLQDAFAVRYRRNLCVRLEP